MLGKTILGYTVDEMIGSGGFGTVYRVSKSNLAGTEIRALKHISIPTKRQYMEVLNSMGGDYQKADDYFVGILKNVIGEIQIIRSMSTKNSANIVTYFENDIVEHSSPRTYDIYILMEYLTPLAEYIQNHPLTVHDVIELAKDMLNALIACHSNNIIHRDIKEDNIFVSSDGLYKLGDFGVSRVVTSKSGAASMKGTPNYIAPEVYLGKEKYNSTVDLYSLGIVLYRLLNGSRGPFLPPYPSPYTSEDEDTAFEKRMKEMIPDLPQYAQNTLGEAIVRALMPRAERYSSAQEFLDAVKRAEHSLTSTDLDIPTSKTLSPQSTVWPEFNHPGIKKETFAINTIPQLYEAAKAHPSNPFKTVSDSYESGRSIVDPPRQAEDDDTKNLAASGQSQQKPFSYSKYAIMILGLIVVIVILLSIFGKHLDAPNTAPDVEPDSSEQVTSDNNASTTTTAQPSGTKYLLEFCPPYQDGGVSYFTDRNGESVSMAGQTYRNGLYFRNVGSDKFALFNLNGQYQTLHFTLGHRDGEAMKDTTIQIFLDGKLAGEYFVSAEGLPEEHMLDLTHAQQMKITGPGWLHYCAIADMMLDRDDSEMQNTIITAADLQRLEAAFNMDKEAAARVSAESDYEKGAIQWPILATEDAIVSKYGYRNHPITGLYDLHTGIDITADFDAEVYAAQDGIVTAEKFNTLWGNYVILSHGGGFVTVYAYLNSTNVSEGDKIDQGQVIGTVGFPVFTLANKPDKTPYLHFEVNKNGISYDPMIELQTTASGKTTNSTEPSATQPKTDPCASGHKWVAATCSAPKTCSVCKTTEGSATGHVWQAATCTVPKTCSSCGETEGDISHKWKAMSDSPYEECSACGKMQCTEVGSTFFSKLKNVGAAGYSSRSCINVHFYDNKYYYVSSDGKTIYLSKELGGEAKEIWKTVSGDYIDNLCVIDDLIFFVYQPRANGSGTLAVIDINGNEYFELTPRSVNCASCFYKDGWLYYDIYSEQGLAVLRTMPGDPSKAEQISNGTIVAFDKTNGRCIILDYHDDKLYSYEMATGKLRDLGITVDSCFGAMEFQGNVYINTYTPGQGSQPYKLSENGELISISGISFGDSFAVASDELYYIARSTKGKINRVNLKDGTYATMTPEVSPVSSFAYNGLCRYQRLILVDNNWLAYLGFDNKVYVYNVASKSTHSLK